MAADPKNPHGSSLQRFVQAVLRGDAEAIVCRPVLECDYMVPPKIAGLVGLTPPASYAHCAEIVMGWIEAREEHARAKLRAVEDVP